MGGINKGRVSGTNIEGGVGVDGIDKDNVSEANIKADKKASAEAITSTGNSANDSNKLTD